MPSMCPGDLWVNCVTGQEGGLPLLRLACKCCALVVGIHPPGVGWRGTNFSQM